MENKVLISVAMCTYNGEKYIKEQIDSILNQSIDNIEIVITDDGSSDNTIEIIYEYMNRDNRVKLYQNENNLGYVKNFEKAISLCTGEYIALSDQDDIWEFNKLEILINKIKNTKNDLVYSNALLVDANLISFSKKLIKKNEGFEKNNNLYFIYNNCISGNTIIFTKVLKEKILPFPDNLSFHDIWISYVASSISSIIFVDEILIKYRQHENNVTNIGVKKAKKNYIEKINSKKNSINNLIYKLYNFEQFLKTNNIDKNLRVISDLLKEYKRFEFYFFNFKLFKIIYFNRNYLFPNKNISILKIVKMGTGLKLYRIMPFL